MKRIPVGGPQVYPVDYIRVARALWKNELSGYSNQYLPRFENEFAKIAGTKFAYAVNSGTSAIYLTLAALNLPKGTPVAVSAYTNMATFFPVIQLGLIPVPIDIDKKFFNLNPDDLQSVVDSNFGAIIVVHIFGQPANMDAIMGIAQKHKIPVIEDCAEAHGATYHGQPVGSFGRAGCFSFYANKLVGTGEGGAISTSNEEFANTVDSMRSLAFGKENKFLHESDGFNFRMTNIQAALGLSQISNLRKTLKRKYLIATRYNEILENNHKLVLPSSTQGSVTWMYHLTLKCGHERCRDSIIMEMGKVGIELRPGFIPFSDQLKILLKYGLSVRATPVASSIGQSAFYLPTSLKLRDDQIQWICRNLAKVTGMLH